MRLTPVDILANWYNDETLPWSAQKAVNCLAETAEVGGTRSVAKTKGLPGLTLLANLETGDPIRGAEDVEGTLFVVSGTSLFQINPDNSFTNRGNIPGVSLVSMAHNKQGGTTAANELVIANGLSGYVYNTDTTVLAQITDDAFPGATTFDYVDGYISFTDPEGRFWGHSALNQATQYSSIDRYDAESAPDKIVSHIVSHREVMVFGTRTTEFFRNTGAATGTFQRVDGTEMEIGIAAPLARARLDNTVYWLGSDGLVYRLAGHSPQRVSTRPIEQAISRFNLDNAFAHTWEDRGHQVFYLTFPDGLTFGFDVATSLWHARETYGLDRWGVNTTTRWNGLWVAGDYTNGKLYRMNWDDYTEDGRPLVMECQPGVTHADGNDVRCPYVELFMDTGQSPNPADLDPLQISGDAPDVPLDSPYSYAYSASGGFGIYAFSFTGSLPPGVTLSTSGVLTGVADTAGSFSFTVTVTDSLGNTASVPDTILVSFAPDLLVMSSTDSEMQLYSGVTPAFPFAQSILPPAINSPLSYSTSQDGSYYASSFLAVPRFRSYTRNSVGNYIEVSSPLSPAPSAVCNGCAVSHDATYLAITQGDEVWLYKADGDDTYTRVAVHLVGAPTATVKFSPDSNYLATTGVSGFGFRMLQRTGDTLTSIFTGGLSDGYGLAWNAESNQVAVTARLQVPQMYSVVGSTVTLIGQGVVAATGTNRCVLSPDGEYLYVNNNTAPNNLQIYNWTGAAFTLVSQTTITATPDPHITMTFDGDLVAISDTTNGTRVHTAVNGVLTLLTTIAEMGPGSHFAKSSDYP